MRIFAVVALLLAHAAAAQTQSTTPAPTSAPSVPLQLPSGIFGPMFPQTPPASTSPQPVAAPAGTAAPGGTAAPAVSGPPVGVQPFNYSVNLSSDVFGATLFTGAFAASTVSIFNPDHVIAIGDQVRVQIWGAYQFDSFLTVDPRGNIFVPQVGPIGVAGVPNKDLQRLLEESLRRTFRSSVHSYISLAAAQPVRVFVTGFVYRPGMYQGTSTDSVLRYLDQAGGIDPDRGSFLDVQVLRGSQVRGKFNLYDFLLSGVLPGVQLGDGDVIIVAPRKSMFTVLGLAENAKRFEFSGTSIELNRLSALAKPFPSATHVRVTRNTGVILNVDYYALSEVSKVQLANGDQIEFTADKRPGTISVRVEGEHTTAQEYVVPYGSRMGDVIRQIKFTERSDTGQLQLFRLSVKARQKDQLQAALNSLQSAVLTARSGTTEEASLRTQEANLFLQWVDRAKKIDPLGQVLIAQSAQRDDLLLEDGDIIRVPVKDGLVLVGGEVLFPNAVAFDARLGIADYVKRAGGYSQTADTSRILIAHRDGSFDEGWNDNAVRAGDQVLVLPKVDSKSRQFWKDITQIIFNIAVSAKIVLGL